MPFQSNNGNNQNGNYPVTTNSMTFFGENMMMLMNFTDDKIHISLRDAVMDENGKRRYPRPASGEEKNSMMLTKERAVAFLRRIKNGFIPKFEEFVETRQNNPSFNTGYSVAVPTNTEMTNMLALNTGKPEGGYYTPSLCFYKGIDMNTRIPAEVKEFKFSQKVPVFTNYDPTTGNYDSQFPEYGQLLVFVAALEDFVATQSKGGVHAFKLSYNDRFSRISHNLEQLCIKQGVPIQQAPSYGGSRSSGGNNPFAGGAGANTNQIPEPTQLKTWDGGDNLLNSVLNEGAPADDSLPY